MFEGYYSEVLLRRFLVLVPNIRTTFFCTFSKLPWGGVQGWGGALYERTSERIGSISPLLHLLNNFCSGK